MDILLYLSELLQQRTSVGIIGLGTFFKKKFAGRYDKEKQSFLPPGYTLQFTTEVKEEELLQNFIAEKKNISKESASYYIAQFAEDTNKKLEIEHEAELENLGRLFFTEHEGLSFEPSKNINYGSEFYGLPSVTETELTSEIDTKEQIEETLPNLHSSEVEVYDEITEAPTKATPLTGEVLVFEENLPVIENIELDEVKDDLKNTLSKLSGETIDVEHDEVTVPDFVIEQHEEYPNRFGHQPESESPKTYINLNDDATAEKNIETPEFVKEQYIEHPNQSGYDPAADEGLEEERKSVWSKFWIAIFILIIIAVITYFIKPEWFGNSQKTEPSAIPTNVIDSTKANKPDTAKAKQDSIAKKDSILKANQVQNKRDTTNAKTSVNNDNNSTITAKNSMFHIIAVSYETEAAAKHYINRVKKIGLNATIAKMEGKRKKVSIASFTTREEAEKQKEILQKRLKGEGFYVKEIKNNTQP